MIEYVDGIKTEYVVGAVEGRKLLIDEGILE